MLFVFLSLYSSLYILVFKSHNFGKVLSTLPLLVFSWKTFQLTWFKLTLWCHSKRELYIVLSLQNWFHFPSFLKIILPRLVVSAWVGLRSKKQFTKLAISPCPLKLNPCLQSVGSSLWGLLRSKQLCIAHWNKLGELGDVLETTLSQLWSALRSKQLVCAHCPAGNQGSRLRRTHFYHHSPNTSTMQTNTAYTFHVLLTLPLGTFCTLWCTDSNWDDSGVYIIPLALC